MLNALKEKKGIHEANFREENGLIVYDTKAPIVSGSQKMMAVTGGVKARIAKDREGAPVVESFLFDKDRFSKETAEQWLLKHKGNIEESLRKVQENAPAGSFQDITIRLQAAIDNLTRFANANDPYAPRPYVCHVFPAYCIITLADEYWKVPYSDSQGSITLSEPEKVEMTFVTKESAIQNEKLNRLAKPNTQISDEFTRISIQEGTFEPTKKEFKCVLIQEGMNFSKRRYYPKDTIRESAPLYAGLKMYINHQTSEEEQKRPERDLKDWGATIKESWYENGKAMGLVHVHDAKLLENLQDEVYREHIGLSINASGRRYMKVIDGMNVEVVEKIIAPRSVDFVTEPGARGRIEESQTDKPNKEHEMEINVKNLRENYGSVVTEIENAAITALKESHSTALAAEKDRADKAEKALNDIKEAGAKSEWSGKVASFLAAHKLPEKSAKRISESIVYVADQKDEDLKKIVEAAVKAEREYLKEVGGIKVGVEGGAEEVPSLMKSLEGGLLEAVGVKAQK